MHLEHLTVANFRCLEAFETDLGAGSVLIIGDNARGKTTLLEAMFYLVTGRSFRTRYDNDCLPWGAAPGTSSAIRGRVRRAQGDSCRLAVTLANGTKTVRVDEQPLAHLAELWGNLRAVLFTPDDLALIKAGPSERRRYLDVALSQIDPDFLFHLQRYNQALRQRNALLRRSERADAHTHEEIVPWDEQLIRHGLPILEARLDFLRALEPRAAALYARIAGEGNGRGEAFGIDYGNFLRTREVLAPDDARAEFRKRLDESLEDDVRRSRTSVGPHRDDFVVSLEGKPVREFASQGQTRSCVLALRLAEVTEMEERTGESPLLLLDDLSSELDAERRRRVMDLLEPRWQTFMTTTQREDFAPDTDFAVTIRLPEDAIT